MTAQEPRSGPRKAWRRHYRVGLYVFLGLAAVDMLVARHVDLWRAYDANPYRDHLIVSRKQAWDLVVVGGSPAVYGFDPAVLAGVRWQGHCLDRVYNLGLALGTMAEVYHAVLHGLTTPPRLLVCGITATDLNDDRVEPNGPRHLMSLRDVARWCRERPDAIEWCLRHFLDERVQSLWQLYYYRNGIQGWAAAQAEQLESGHWPRHALTPPIVIPGDEEKRLDHLRAAGKVKDSFPFLERYRLGGYLTYLHLLLDWGEQHGVTVVLVDLPVPADLDERLCPKQFATYHAALVEVERARGVRVLRATREAVGLTDAHFADLIHLNARGKARLSAWVRQALAAAEPTDEHEAVRAE